ncbi:MAG: DNA adenine methylase [Actinobacteria bacterium]|nr:DNA adenine methylase [Actinomycetota bacterium]
MYLIEKQFPAEKLDILALREGNAKKPIYQIHKWWARRLGCVFRMILLSALSKDNLSELELWQKFYSKNNYKGMKILDPFMGGGTTIVEALRLGCDVIGVDINPVAWFIAKKEIEKVSIYDLKSAFYALEKKIGEEIKKYYKTLDEHNTISEVMYILWIKVINCEKCNSRIKLFPDFILSSNKNSHIVFCPNCLAIETVSDASKKIYCKRCNHSFIPQSGIAKNGSYRCPLCSNVSSILSATKKTSGPAELEIFAIEYFNEKTGRGYKIADENDRKIFQEAKKEFLLKQNSLLFPKHKIPVEGRSDPRPVNYGYKYFYQLFNERQLLCLSKLLKSILEISDPNIREFMLIVFSDCLGSNNMFCKYETEYQKISLMFGLHAYHPINRPTENNVWGTKYGRGTFTKCFEKLIKAKVYAQNTYERIYDNGQSKKIYTGEQVDADLFDNFSNLKQQGQQAVLKAQSSENLTFIPDKSIDFVITDPPYFDNLNYSELAEFFYVWLHLGLKDHYDQFKPDYSSSPNEIVQNIKDGKDLQFFQAGLTNVFRECKRTLKENGLLVFTFHHNKLWAWESLLNTILESGFYVSSANPVRSEGKSGFHSSPGNIKYDMVISCRKQPSPFPSLDIGQIKKEVLATTEICIKRLASNGADLKKVDTFSIIMGKFFEYYTQHYSKIDHENQELSLLNILEGLYKNIEMCLKQLDFKSETLMKQLMLE